MKPHYRKDLPFVLKDILVRFRKQQDLPGKKKILSKNLYAIFLYKVKPGVM